MRLRALVSALFVVAAAVSSAPAAEKIEFTLVPNFLQVPADITLGGGSAVAVDDTGNVYFFHRGKSPLLKFDKNGKFLRAWGDDLISRPHTVRIDKEQNVWLSCTGHHLVLKYSPEGKLLLTLGTADKPGLGNDQFNRPTDVAFGPKGQVYVSDGYGNARVMEFDSRGAFVKTWGKPGDGPGEFNLPHSIRVDSRGRILVGDRTNNRIQLFDADGKLLDIWTGIYPCGLEIDRDGTIFVADPNAQQILQLDADGKLVHKWGERGLAIGQFDGCHMLGVDPKGDLYVAEVEGKRMQKFARKR